MVKIGEYYYAVPEHLSYLMPGKVIYVHPKNRFVVLEFGTWCGASARQAIYPDKLFGKEDEIPPACPKAA